jgi:pimeloyl-ACP methyl ester carboxylesterase
LIVFDSIKSLLIGFHLPSLHLTTLYELPGVVGGGVWLDSGNMLAANHSPHGTYTAGVVVDLAKRCYETIFNLSDRSNETIAGHLEGGRSLLVSTDAFGWIRCGVINKTDPAHLHLFGKRAGTLSDTIPCGATVAGAVLIHEQQGALSKLHVWDSRSGLSTEVPLRQCRVYHHTAVVGTRANFLLSAPDLPLGLGTLNERASRVSVRALHCLPGEIRHVAPQLKTFALEGGDVESICYNWGSKLPVAVFTLHGGPVNQWYYEFDPFLQALAQTGVAVIAPNCSGSTGYGASYLGRILNGFGRRDAEELVLIRDRYIRHDFKVLLVGISYGGYLALRAASRWPGRFSGVAVISAFASLAELYCDTSPAVKRMLESLNPDPEALSTRGEGNIALDRVQADLLILHGILDPVVPVVHARRMRQRLVEAGRCEGEQFRYIECSDMGHNLSTYAARRNVFPEVISFIEKHIPVGAGGRV